MTVSSRKSTPSPNGTNGKERRTKGPAAPPPAVAPPRPATPTPTPPPSS